jgi:mRNA-degrading endonuclease RelE of RelBE toxin-antitoxin system
MRGFMSSARAAILALVAVACTAGAVALLGGCGDDSKATVDRDGTLRLRVEEYRIVPENVRTRSGRIHLVVHNAGRLTHNVSVETFSDSPETDSPVELGRTSTAHPGETVSELKRITLKPGKYRLVCTIGNHDDLGQYATLVVRKR